jgi:hypothetical protein
MKTPINRLVIASAFALIPAMQACGGTPITNNTPDADLGDGGGSGDEWDQRLGERQTDYNAALRIASLRLQGEMPNMTDIRTVADAGGLPAQKTAYETIIVKYMSGPKFAAQALSFWRDSFKIGEAAGDTAPTFATQLTVENRSYLELFTAATGNCPTMDIAAGTFTPGNCASGAPANAGVLTNPTVMKSFYSNFAFRRVKWVQETFVCTKFPAEYGTPVDVGNPTNLFSSPWAFTSIAGTDSGGRVDFKDVSAVVCANCHASMNHIAPLFANFDKMGDYKATISVETPLEGTPLAKITDYFPAGETTAWRFGKPAADLTSLGAAMAADPAVAECAVARAWNWALGKTDIVDSLETVPTSTISTQVAQFTSNGHKIKDLIFAVFTSDDFTKF